MSQSLFKNCKDEKGWILSGYIECPNCGDSAELYEKNNTNVTYCGSCEYDDYSANSLDMSDEELQDMAEYMEAQEDRRLNIRASIKTNGVGLTWVTELIRITEEEGTEEDKSNLRNIVGNDYYDRHCG